MSQVDGADPSLPSGFPGRGQDGNNPPSSNPPIDAGKKARFFSLRGALSMLLMPQPVHAMQMEGQLASAALLTTAGVQGNSS